MSTDYSRGLRERWIAWRNRVLSDPRFQRWAVRFPATRPIAQRQAGRLFDLVAGFTYSQTLLAFIQLGLTERLAAGAMRVADVARATDLSDDAADRLLRAAVALGLAERVAGGRFALGMAGAALKGNPGVAAMVAHHPLLYADLVDPVAVLRDGKGRGKLAGLWPYANADHPGAAEGVAEYSALMAGSQPIVAEQIMDAYRFGEHRRMLDVGGGQGAFVGAVAARVPRLEFGLFDLPAVIARCGLVTDGRVTGHAGDFHVDPIPRGYDLITLVRVLHDHDDAPALALLSAIHEALPAGGRVLIAEPMAETRGAEPGGDAYFGLYLWAMGSGRPRPPREIAAMLKRAGFAQVRVLKTALPLTVRAIVATRQ